MGFESESPPASARPTEAVRDDRFTVFAFLWAFSCFFHVWMRADLLVDQLDPANHPPGQGLGLIVTAACALLVLYAPSRPGPFLLMCVAQLACFVIQLPLVADSWVLTAFVNLAIVTSAIRLRRRDGALTPGRLLDDFAGPARWVLLLCYGFAALAKYNSDFLCPDTSCAVFLQGLVGVGPDVPLLYVGMSVGAESLGPLLLAVPRTRKIGLVVLFLFHGLVSISPAVRVFNFTATLLALWFLFTPRRFAPVLRVPDGVRRVVRVASVPILLAMLAVVVGARHVEEGRLLQLFVSYLVLAVASVALTFVLLRVPADPIGTRAFRLPGPHRVLVVVVLLNGLSPYLGLKTDSAFSMFSNLRTEAGVTNHVFMPVFTTWGPQSDLVEIRESSCEALQTLADDGNRITWFELRRRFSGERDASLTYVRGGRVVALARIADDEELCLPPPYLLRKLLIFRVVADPQPCWDSQFRER